MDLNTKSLMTHSSFVRVYAPTLLLMSSILLGGAVGYYFDGIIPYLKPVGDVFIRLLLTLIVPFIFFNIVNAIARIQHLRTVTRLFITMTMIFLITGVFAATLAMIVMTYYPPNTSMNVTFNTTAIASKQTLTQHLADLTTVSDFSHLFSHQHILALILFSLLVGLATSTLTSQQRPVLMTVLGACEALFTRVFSMVMTIAPIGFFAYFAVLIHDIGPSLMHQYARITTIYYLFGGLYFIIVYSLYAYLAGHWMGLRTFWRHISLPAITSVATCSGAASIPANLIATKAMHVPDEIADTVIPIGSMLHKEGSIIGGVFKIAFLFSIFHLNLTGFSTWITAIGVSTLVGMIMGAIPSGGLLGELFILGVYGFPSSALLTIAAISIIIDPLATLLNVTGNSVCSLLVTRVGYIRHKKTESTA